MDKWWGEGSERHWGLITEDYRGDRAVHLNTGDIIKPVNTTKIFLCYPLAPDTGEVITNKWLYDVSRAIVIARGHIEPSQPMQHRSKKVTVDHDAPIVRSRAN
jgi:hypothetical protein